MADGAADQFEAHRVDFRGRRLDAPLDFLQREGVVSTLVPIALAIDGVEIEAARLRGETPVIPFRAVDALHEARSTAGVAVSVAMTVPMEVVQRATETAIDGAAMEPPVRTGQRLGSRTTGPCLSQPHRGD